MNKHTLFCTAAAGLLLASAGASAAPVTIKYLFNNAANTVSANPGLDASLAIPAGLSSFSTWSDTDGTFAQNFVGVGAGGQYGSAAALSFNDGNAFKFSFAVSPGYKFEITEINFAQQGSSGNRGNGPDAWKLFINNTQIGNPGTTTLGSYGTRSVTGLPVSFLAGVLDFKLAASGAALSGSTWRVDNFTITGDLQPVPVPAAVWLLGSAVAGIAGLRRRAA